MKIEIIKSFFDRYMNIEISAKTYAKSKKFLANGTKVYDFNWTKGDDK